MKQEFLGIIRLENFDFHIELSRNHIKKYGNDMRYIGLLFEQIQPSESSTVINKGQKISMTRLIRHLKWSPDVTMYQIKRRR